MCKRYIIESLLINIKTGSTRAKFQGGMRNFQGMHMTSPGSGHPAGGKF